MNLGQFGGLDQLRLLRHDKNNIFFSVRIFRCKEIEILPGHLTMVAPHVASKRKWKRFSNNVCLWRIYTHLKEHGPLELIIPSRKYVYNWKLLQSNYVVFFHDIATNEIAIPATDHLMLAGRHFAACRFETNHLLFMSCIVVTVNCV